MAYLHIRISETDNGATVDKAVLDIECDPDEKFISLSINNGDAFEFDVDELLRALNAVFMFRKPTPS